MFRGSPSTRVTGKTGPLDEDGLVRPVKPVPAGRVKGPLEDGVEESLRGLDAEEPAPVQGPDDEALADLLGRVLERGRREWRPRPPGPRR